MSENIFYKLRDDIENGIVTGEFEPGERLDETQLAMRFGVSRTPIREALMQLSAIGLVEIRPRRGAVVVDPAPQRVYEMFEVMAELEGMAVLLPLAGIPRKTVRLCWLPTRNAGRRSSARRPIATIMKTRYSIVRYTRRAIAAFSRSNARPCIAAFAPIVACSSEFVTA